MSNAFLVVFSIEVLPAEVETPNNYICSVLAANTIAIVSSSPGSQSNQT